jgi:hypothetical protein
MAKTPSYKTNSPVYTAAGLGGHSHYGNVTIAGAGAGLTYSTGAGSANWATTAAAPYYTAQPKVNITSEDIQIDGLSLKETMLAVKNELMIPTRINRNAELEREFAELKEWADKYTQLEEKFLEQKKMWETLKRTDQ